jgi:hypothetical protein
MANEYEIKLALRKAAEALVKRRITEAELGRLYQLYLQETGTDYQRAVKSLSRFSQFTEAQIVEKRSTSDDLDRLMSDLQDKLGK